MTFINKIISTATILTCLASPMKVKATGSVELIAGDKNTTLDVRLTEQLAPRLEFFTAHQVTVDYENNLGYYGLVSLGCNVIDGFNVLAQAEGSLETGVKPRFGAEYFKQIDDLSLYVEVASTIEKNPTTELFGIIGYRPKITDDLRFVINVENITLLSFKNGHDYSTQKFRIGLGAGKFEFGPAVNVEEFGGLILYNLGAAVKLNI